MLGITHRIYESRERVKDLLRLALLFFSLIDKLSLSISSISFSVNLKRGGIYKLYLEIAVTTEGNAIAVPASVNL
jgi:uncharacterized membrane protein